MSEVKTAELVALREGTPGDTNFILATWLRGLYYGDTWFSEIPKHTFMTKYHQVVEGILASPSTQVRIACLKDDPEVILGYAIFGQQGVIHWVFVKKAWRGVGIATSLVPLPLVTTVTHLTKTGLGIIKKHPTIHFNPFAI